MADPQEYRWPCDACGAQLRFAPGQTELVCDHCGHVQKLPGPDARSLAEARTEHDLMRALRDDLPGAAMQEVRTVTCTNCGAQIEFQGADHATECPFCASPVVVDTGSHRQIKPQAVVPFQLNERAAREAMVRWMGNLWFAPNSLMEYARKGRAMNGVYVPYWTFDAETDSRYSGQRGDYYYETRTVTVRENGRSVQRQERVRKTRWHSVSGRVSRDFDDVLILGSTGVPQAMADRLDPWDLGALVPYAPDYLAGFSAEGYTVPLAQAHDTARDRMSGVIVQDVRRDIGGDEQRVDGVDTDWRAETFKHILLPVWLAAYKYNGKSYRFLVNGQTGEVQGERPWSAWKIAFALVLAALVAGIGAWLYQKYK
ncbi:primosomal protein N' (replication factor Y) - superfamily II helicase [Xinfangfangia pollutisoli]|uniref:primosomal protein N' (replication factor Y) - superfamily II helicase n=1 Tax=Xinfangfangia pollutisoli TaxID=2865960 RepID=UPI001CD7B3FE|nr:primosomal protein N' (replication factor Y) - superfamily II helicase [Xinfangfangia pollutisoli]